MLPESLAVGSRAFVEGVKAQLGIGGRCRQIQNHGVAHTLREPEMACGDDFGPRIVALSDDGAHSVG